VLTEVQHAEDASIPQGDFPTSPPDVSLSFRLLLLILLLTLLIFAFRLPIVRRSLLAQSHLSDPRNTLTIAASNHGAHRFGIYPNHCAAVCL